MAKAKKKPAPVVDSLMLPEEVAAQLRCDERTLANWRSQGKGPAYLKVGGLVRYRDSDVKKYLLENYETPF